MPKVSYNGDGNTGGSVPVDNTSYAAGGSFTVAAPGGLSYLSQLDGGGHPVWPKAPADDHTIPFFATSQQPNFNDPGDPEFKAGGSTGTGANNQTIAIAAGDTQWAYFGC